MVQCTPAGIPPLGGPQLAAIHSECSEKLVSSVIADGREVLVVVTDILLSDDGSDNAKLKSVEVLGEYYSLFDGAFGDEPRDS